MTQRRQAPGSQTSLREANLIRVRDTLLREGAMTQIELASRTGLSQASISNLVKELFDLDQVDVSRVVRNGRRATLVTLSDDRRLFAAIHCSHRELSVAVSRDARTLLATARMPLANNHVADATLDRATYLLADLLAEHRLSLADLSCVAVALPAPVDALSGQVGSEAIMEGWRGVSVQEDAQTLLGCPVILDNDANFAAVAEARSGALMGVSQGVYLLCGHGVGAGLIINGALFRGAAGTAGELGHLTLDENGPLCACGNRGCLDTFVGSKALLEAVRPARGDIRLGDLLRLVEARDPGAQRVIADAGRHLGAAVAGLVNILNPNVIVVGGLVGAAGPTLIRPMREMIDRLAVPSAAASVELKGSELGSQAVVFGALAAAMAHHVDRVS